jgi:hypothetical protein
MVSSGLVAGSGYPLHPRKGEKQSALLAAALPDRLALNERNLRGELEIDHQTNAAVELKEEQGVLC